MEIFVKSLTESFTQGQMDFDMGGMNSGTRSNSYPDQSIEGLFWRAGWETEKELRITKIH